MYWDLMESVEAKAKEAIDLIIQGMAAHNDDQCYTEAIEILKNITKWTNNNPKPKPLEGTGGYHPGTDTLF